MPGGEKNTYGLPDGDAIRTELAAIFREQRIALLDWMDSEGYKAFGLPQAWPTWESLKLGAADIAARVRQPIADIWEQAGKSWMLQNGLDPSAFDVGAPDVRAGIDAQAMNLGTEVNAKTTGLLDGLLRKVRDLFNRGKISLTEAIKRLRKGVTTEVKPMEAWRARRIAVTEAARAHHAAMVAAGYKSGDVVGWRWLAAADACPICSYIEDHAQFVPLGQPFAIIGTGEYSVIEYPPVHPNCCLPETPVVAPVRVAGIVAQYDGPVVRLVFADGTDITVTPNHMLLTVEGFAPASSLLEGDEVIKYSGADGMPRGVPDDHRQPTTIKQIVDAMAVTSGVTASRVPVSPEYLHGDAAHCEGEIHVVSTDRHLACRAFGHGLELIGTGHQAEEEIVLDHRLPRGVSFPALGDLAAVLFALRDATDGGVGSIRERKAASLADSLHTQLHGVGGGSGRDAQFVDSAAYHRARDADRLRYCLFRFPGLVTTTKVVKVDRDTSHYVGPVYDVQTLTSLYLAGNVVSSNCRCTIVEVLISDEQPGWSETLIDPVPEPQDYPPGEVSSDDAALKAQAEEQAGVSFVPPPSASGGDYVTVVVDVAKVDAAWSGQDTYVGPGGAGGIGGRYENFQAFLARARVDGTPIEQPRAGLDAEGVITIGDGRHRLAVFRDRGQTLIPITVPGSDARKIRLRYGP